MDNTTDLLQIKIEVAKGRLSEDTRQAIDAVDFKEVIMRMRESKGYTFEQLGDLETETELLLCGLITPDDYPKELEKRMRISRQDAEGLVREMNNLVFKKIQNEFIKRTEKKRASPRQEKETSVPETQPVALDTLKSDMAVLKSHGIEITSDTPQRVEQATMEPKVPLARSPEAQQENPAHNNTHPILVQKLSSSFQIPTKKNEYGLDSLPTTPEEKQSPPQTSKPTLKPTAYPKNADPYRMPPE